MANPPQPDNPGARPLSPYLAVGMPTPPADAGGHAVVAEEAAEPAYTPQFDPSPQPVRQRGSEAPPEDPPTASEVEADRLSTLIPQPIPGGDADVMPPILTPPPDETFPSRRGSLFDPVAFPDRITPPPSGSSLDELSHDAVSEAELGKIKREARTPAATDDEADPVTAELLAVAGSPFVPTFAADAVTRGVFAPTSGEQDLTPSGNSPGGAHISADTPRILKEGEVPDLEHDNEPPYTPKAGPGFPAPEADAGAGGPEGGDTDGDETPWWKKPWVLIAAGVVLVGVFVGIVVAATGSPAPVTAPTPTVTASAAAGESAVDTSTGTAFLQAMPTSVGAFVLVSAEPAADDPALPSVAEAWLLTYEREAEQYGVTATQFFTPEAAEQGRTVLAGEGAVAEPVLVDGQPVGSSTSVDDGTVATITWSNGTTVFVLTGPSEGAEGFFAQFGF